MTLWPQLYLMIWGNFSNIWNHFICHLEIIHIIWWYVNRRTFRRFYLLLRVIVWKRKTGVVRSNWWLISLPLAKSFTMAFFLMYCWSKKDERIDKTDVIVISPIWSLFWVLIPHVFKSWAGLCSRAKCKSCETELSDLHLSVSLLLGFFSILIETSCLEGVV